MASLKYGICECEYPCGCVEYAGKRYSGWEEIIKDQAAYIKHLKEKLYEMRLERDKWFNATPEDSFAKYEYYGRTMPHG